MKYSINRYLVLLIMLFLVACARQPLECSNRVAVKPSHVVLYYAPAKPILYKVIGTVAAENNNLIGFARPPEVI
ncbi:hypothetical protein OFN51_31850, partial [Escherichia coli]|nr:hypothetical protein [Escherichia coli]